MDNNEAFEKWAKDNWYVIDDSANALKIWQAAQQQSDGEIAELEEKLERKEIADKSYALAITTAMIEKDTAINELKADNETLVSVNNKMTNEIVALEADNKRLREALVAMVNSAKDHNCGLRIADEALSATTLQGESR